MVVVIMLEINDSSKHITDNNNKQLFTLGTRLGSFGTKFINSKKCWELVLENRWGT